MTVPTSVRRRLRSIRILAITGSAEIARAVPTNRAKISGIGAWLCAQIMRKDEGRQKAGSKRNGHSEETHQKRAFALAEDASEVNSPILPSTRRKPRPAW